MDNHNEKEMTPKIDLVSVSRDLLRNWWIIILLAVSVSLFADVWYLRNYKPVYTSKTTFVVTYKGLNSNLYRSLNTTKNLATRFSQVLDSTILKDRVAKDLGMDQFEGEATAQVIEETNMLEVIVKADTAAGSYKLLQSIMDNYDFVSNYVVNDAVLETLEKPVIPAKPDNPFDEKGTLIRFLIYGFLGAAVLMIAISHFRDTVKNETDFKKKVDAQLLGSVFYEDKSKGMPSTARTMSGFFNKQRDDLADTHPSMLISSPIRSFRFVESNKMTAARIRSKMDKRDVKVLMVTSVMENEGKSTVIANLALALAMEQKKVLLIDCDFRKPSLYKLFKVAKENTIALSSVMDEEADLGNIITRWKDTSLYTIFNNEAMALERLLESGVIAKILDFCRDRFDYIVVDSSPMALVSDTEELAQMADGSVLVVHEDMVLSKDINDAIDILNNTHGKILGCVLNEVTEGLVSGQAYGYSTYSGYGRSYEYGRGRAYGNYSNYRSK